MEGHYVRTFFILATTLFLVPSASMAKKERAYGQICLPRVPALDLEKAITIAREHNNLSEKSFVDEAILKCENKTYSWKIGFRLKEHETGHFIVTVFMDGTAKITVVKDG